MINSNKKSTMRIALTIFFVASFSFASCQNKANIFSEDQNKIEAERLKLKNVAFCTCLYKSFPQKDSVFANEGSAAAYLELGAHSLDAYNKVMDAATRYSIIQYQSKYNRDLSIMKCLDFYNSNQLDDLIKSLDSEINFGEPRKNK
jgi:hypothetical protein